MSPVTVRGFALHVLTHRTVTRTEHSVHIGADGQEGYVLFGPYMQAPAGVYRVVVEASLIDKTQPGSSFDVHADGVILAQRFYREPLNLVLYIPGTSSLEFRFKTAGETADVHAIHLIPLLLDKDAVDAPSLRALIDTLADADADASGMLRLFDRLAQAGDAAVADAARTAWVEQSPALSVRRALKRLHQPGPVEPLGRHLKPEQIAPVVAAERLTSFDLFSLTAEDHRRLQVLGYDVNAIQATRDHRAYTERPRHWQGRPGEGVSPGRDPDRSPVLVRLDRADYSFQTAAITEGVTAYCPRTGERLRSKHGFVAYYAGMSFIFYRFVGQEVFYLLAGEATGGKSLLYMPRTSTVVLIMEPGHRWYPKAELIYRLQLQLVSEFDAVADYLRSDTRPAAVTSNNNMGHSIWNDLNGLNHALETGLGDHLVEVILLPGQFLPVPRVFPELAGRTPPETTPEAAFRHCLEARLLPIRFADAVMGPSLAERLRRTAADNATSGAEPPQDAKRPFIWINLRAHSKMWLEQVEGYAFIINSLHADYGQLTILLDGFKDCREMADGIRALSHPEVVFHDGLTFTLLDSINWAFAVDAYICTIGSGLVLLTWIAGRRGVAHAEQLHMEQMSWWPAVRPDVPAPVTPPLEEIRDADLGPHGNRFYCNYHLDAPVVLDLIRDVLDEALGVRPTRHDLRPAPDLPSEPEALEHLLQDAPVRFGEA